MPNAKCQTKEIVFILHSAVQIFNSKTLGGEIESRLAYTQKSEGQNLPGRPTFAGQLWLAGHCLVA
jgi:hypothetical protein